MALQVWLPLTGNLKNQGLLEDLTINSTNVSFLDNGKIGKCFTGHTGYFNIPYFTGKKQFSVAYWVKVNTATATNWLDAFRWYSTDGSSSYVSRNEFYTNCTKTGFWFAGSPNSMSGKDTTVGEWHHHAFVIDYSAGTAQFYIDGVSVGAVTGVYTTHSLTGENFMIGENGLDLSINDLRIYDHCLSPKEVKELSKGLVAHYPLNDMIGGENLIKDSYIERTCEYPSSGVKDFYAPITTKVPSGTTYTLSFYAKSTVNGDHLRTHYYSPNTTTTCVSSQGITKTASDGNMDFVLTTEWKYYWVVYNQSETTAVKHVICPRLISQAYASSVSGTGIVSVKMVKFEKGSIATPWIPNPADTLYTKLGLDDNIVYDCSGYGHNGDIVGSISINSEAPRYAVSSSFSGSEQILAESPTAEAKSASLWIYIPSIGTNNLVFADYKSKLAFGFYSSYIITAVTGDNNYRTTYESSLLTNNSWHHIVIVKSEPSGMELWIDGVKQTPRSGYDAWNPGMSDGLTIGARTNGNNKFIGSISDLRIYATALSAEDVKSLYETRASIDNYNNIYAYELMEV